MEWISVEDRLPEEGDVVLTFSKNGGRAVRKFDNGQFGYYDDITHWMPLPDPPNEK
jgi:hypothetical protein